MVPASCHSPPSPSTVFFWSALICKRTTGGMFAHSWYWLAAFIFTTIAQGNKRIRAGLA